MREGQSLANIGDQTTVYFKNYGSQQLSTISLRGTSASHTSVIWNGITVNSPTLGQTDFSVWPMFLTDQILIQKGGGSSLFGSGAIGGTVILDNSKIRADSLISLYVGVGSFGQRDAGLRIQLKQKQLITETSVFSSLLENDFRLEDGSIQEHAAVDRLGFSNKIALEYNRGELFTEVAYAKNDRDIQPTRTSASRNTLVSENIRTVINNKLYGGITHHSTLGFIKDKTTYNDSSITTSYRFTANHTIEKSFGSFLFTRLGSSGMHEWVKSENFKKIEKRMQGHVFTSGTFIHDLGDITLNLRQAFYANESAFIPALGVETSDIIHANISLRGQISRDYRAPTFNDLFWLPGGNRELKSERSLNYEFGADYAHSNFKISWTGFRSHITNWIQWMPEEGIWTPNNIREVETTGIEAYSTANFSISKTKIFLEAEYSYILSTDKGLVEENQLPYVPKHSAMGSMALIFGDSRFDFIANYTGRRFTTLSNSRANRIDGFLLIDIQLSNEFLFTSAWLKAAFKVLNVADVNYENLKNTAMPGRAFLIELTTKF